MYHRRTLPPDEEFWRNYDWHRDYLIIEKGKHSKLKVRVDLWKRVRIFKRYLRENGYRVYGSLVGIKYITIWYAKL